MCLLGESAVTMEEQVCPVNFPDYQSLILGIVMPREREAAPMPVDAPC